MDKVSRRLTVTVRMELSYVEQLEVISEIDKMRPSKKAEMIIMEYLESHPVNDP